MTQPQTNPPSIRKRAFECPHCGAYTSQTWYRLHAGKLSDGPPNMPDESFKKRVQNDKAIDEETRSQLLSWVDQMLTKRVFLEGGSWTSLNLNVNNLSLSQCFVCSKISVWVHDSVVSPFSKDGPPHHPDMPDYIARDYDEARTILGRSPRGAAALLRLCVQELCEHVGEKNRKIDDAIAALVAKGLSPIVQQALDSVRVIGNEAVHPGTIDLRDDTDTAEKLFGLVNVIVDRMIGHPKQVNEIYQALPESKRAAIDARNARAQSEGTQD